MSASNSKLNYSAFDKHPMYGINYYRLKQTDVDEKYTYSAIVAIENTGKKVVIKNIRPNPTTNDISFDINISLFNQCIW